MDIQRVAGSQFVSKLPNGFEVWLPLNIPNGPANLRDNDVVILGFPKLQHPMLNLVDNVRNHLNCFSQICSAALLIYDLKINSAGRNIIGLTSRYA